VVGYVQAVRVAAVHEPVHRDKPPAQAGRLPCGGPEVTAEQTPGLPVTSQASHCPPHALLQHKPSTQMPELHSTFPPQPVPFAFLATQVPIGLQ
jgi:hypothetical protein